MALFDDNISTAEWTILKLIAKGIKNDDEKAELKYLLLDVNISWGNLIEKATIHKLLPLLYCTLLDFDIFRSVNSKIIQLMKSYYDSCCTKEKLYRQAALDITRELSHNSIPYIMPKGLILSKQLYQYPFSRPMNDIDLIVDISHKTNVEKILNRQGYCQGYIDLKNNNIMSFSREEHILCNITKNKMLGHVKKSENALVPPIYIGVDFSVTWSDCPIQLPLNTLFQSKEAFPIDNKNNLIDSFSLDIHFIYIILHLLKHAWSKSLQDSKDGCNLLQFADVYRFWEKYKNDFSNMVKCRIKEFKIEKYVAWVLGHTDNIFGSSIVNELNLQGFANCKWLNTLVGTRGKIITPYNDVQDNNR